MIIKDDDIVSRLDLRMEMWDRCVGERGDDDDDDDGKRWMGDK